MNIESQNQLNSLLPNRILRLGSLIKILSSDKTHALTIRDIITRHSSALDLNRRASTAAVKMIERDLNDLINSGQVSTIGGRPRAFYKVISNNCPGEQHKTDRPKAANDNAPNTDIYNLAFLNRIIKEPGVDFYEVTSKYAHTISESIEVIKQNTKADFFYLSPVDKFNGKKPLQVSADLVGIIVRPTTVHLISVSPSKRLKHFDIRGVSDFKAINAKSHTKLDEQEVQVFMTLAYDNATTLNSTENSPTKNYARFY